MNMPDAKVILLSDIPLDPTYTNSIFFKTKEEQYNYFIRHKDVTYDNLSYVKIDKHKIRVGERMDNIIRCNYLMFRQRETGVYGQTKWFYAFITNMAYIADATTEITFEIDVIQTWMLDWQLGQCLVERTHTPTDNVGDNLIEEDIDLGDEMVINYKQEYNLYGSTVWVLSSKDSFGGLPAGRLINGVYSGLFAYKFSMPAELDNLNAYLKHFEGEEGTIVAIYQAPPQFSSASGASETMRWRIRKPYGHVDGYVPKNNKLLTYPYCCLKLSNNRGENAIYHWEDFLEDGLEPTGYYSFMIAGVAVPTVECMCYPARYKNQPENFEEGLTLNGFPQCSWVGDPFKAWLAQSSWGTAVNTMKHVVGSAAVVGGAAAKGAIAASAAGGSAVAAAAGPVLVGGLLIGGAAAASIYAKKHSLEHTPPQVYGQARNGNLNFAIDRVKFSAYYMSIKQEIARSIDDYFNLYGYAVHRVQQPLLNARPHWTYIKTAGCNVRGRIPGPDTTLIRGIFDNGITFWVDGDEVGSYNLDNRPV